MSTPPFLDLPETARTYQLATERGSVAVFDTAPSGATRRETAVLVPGLTGSKEDFIAVLADLAASGHRVVAIDQRGQYESVGPATPDGAGNYVIPELGQDLHAVIAAIGDGPVHLVGHSFGGLVSRAATIAQPSAVRSLTLLNSGPAALSGPPADRAQLLIQALDLYDLPTLWTAMQAVDAAAGAQPPADPAVREFLRRRFVGNSALGLRVMAEQLLVEADRVAELATTGVPAMVCCGVDDDVWTPELQADMARRLGAEYAAIDLAGHSAAAEQPEATARTLAGFWAGVERTAVPQAGALIADRPLPAEA